MFFRNLIAYRVDVGTTIDLTNNRLQPCGQFDPISLGWISPRGNDLMLHIVNNQVIFLLGAEEKILPAAVIKRAAGAKAKEIEAAEGRRVGRKEMRDLREAMTVELMPRAFVRNRSTWAWLDPVNGWLVIDSASPKKADELLELLRSTCDIKVRLLKTETSPGSAMTGWIAAGEAPGAFTIDQDLDLESAEHAKVKYVKHSLESEEIRKQIAEGKVVRKLAMTWADRISFVLTDTLQLKRLSFLDILKEENDGQAENEDERFDLDVTLMTGELAKLLADLVKAMGGEVEE